MCVASSPGLAQKSGKGPGHTFSYVLCQQSSFAVEEYVCPLQITELLTREDCRLVPRPFENENEANRVFENLKLGECIYVC